MDHGSKYAFDFIDYDRSKLIEQLWKPREGDLPVPPPVIRSLDLPTFDWRREKDGIEIRPVSVERRTKGGVGSILTKGRSALYGLLSVGFLFGVNLRGTKDLGAWEYLLLAGIFVGAMTMGWIQTQNEREVEVLSLIHI